ncbi:site-specific integrase [Gaoshiqia sediminis]|uniref:Site-specific integrase n=1 Tax=Gaoshiqia sediminis TaxID=2986998 RepID=A0AA42C6Q4_9BACT|nr:site-specific integrase [Gaoshiqia sediminis]MCW0484173.1 site-specific integrase [Gaoshiqia sediminis]
MRVTINLLLKNSKGKSESKKPVYARITMDNRRIEVSTGVFIDPALWDKKRQLLIGKDEEARVTNSRISKFSTHVNDCFNQLVSVGEEFDIYDLKDQIIGKRQQKLVLEAFDQVIESIAGKIDHGYSFSTLKHYRTCRNRMVEFISREYHRPDLPLSRVNVNFLDRFDIFLKSKIKISSNTAWGYHKDFKHVLNDAVSKELILKNPYSDYKVKSMTSNRDFLTREELLKLTRKSFPIKRLEVVRDLFVFACYTGLSFSDMEKLSPDHIFKGDDKELWVIIDRTKTSTRCRIPILPTALRIIEKYKEHPKSGATGKVLPVHSNQKMNAYLKEIADVCGIRKTLTMHVARHTFATTITLSNGVPLETVSKMLGHSSLKTTQIYARVIDSKISSDMKLLKRQLEKSHL